MEIQLQNGMTAFIPKSTIPEKISSTVLKNAVSNDVPYEVTISKEGYDSYRQSIQNKNNSIEGRNEDKDAYKAFFVKSTIDISGQTQMAFHSQLKKINTQVKESKGVCDALDMAGSCFAVYTQMYDEIKRGYAEGSREFWIVDNGGENGFRKVTEEEELAALDSAYDFYAQVVDAYVNYGMKVSKTIDDAVNRLRAEIEDQKYAAEAHQEKQDKKTDDLYDRLLASANAWKNRYSIDAGNLAVLFKQIFNENFSDL